MNMKNWDKKFNTGYLCLIITMFAFRTVVILFLGPEIYNDYQIFIIAFFSFCFVLFKEIWNYILYDEKNVFFSSRIFTENFFFKCLLSISLSFITYYGFIVWFGPDYYVELPKLAFAYFIVHINTIKALLPSIEPKYLLMESLSENNGLGANQADVPNQNTGNQTGVPNQNVGNQFGVPNQNVGDQAGNNLPLNNQLGWRDHWGGGYIKEVLERTTTNKDVRREMIHILDKRFKFTYTESSFKGGALPRILSTDPQYHFLDPTVNIHSYNSLISKIQNSNTTMSTTLTYKEKRYLQHFLADKYPEYYNSMLKENETPNWRKINKESIIPKLIEQQSIALTTRRP